VGSPSKLTRILGLAGYRVTGFEQEGEDPRARITLFVERGGRKRCCSGCGRWCLRLRDSKVRPWDDLPWGAHPVTLLSLQWRVDCPRCGVRTELVPFAAPKARLTRRLQQLIGLDCQSMPTRHAAVRHQVSWGKARRAEKAFLQAWDAARPPYRPRYLGSAVARPEAAGRHLIVHRLPFAAEVKAGGGASATAFTTAISRAAANRRFCRPGSISRTVGLSPGKDPPMLLPLRPRPLVIVLATTAAFATTSSVLAGCGGSSGSAADPGDSNDGWVDHCPAFPSFPDASCTGPTSSGLPLYTGSLELRTDDQVIENVEMRIDQGLYVPASHVTFRNVKIVFTGALDSDFTMVNLNYNSGTVFQDCELDGQGNVARAITGSGVTVLNCHIHHVGNAIETETPLVAEGNYIHDIYEPDGTDWHADGIQTPMSSHGVTIRHNTVFGRDPSTSAIMGTPTDPATDVLIEHNLLAGGGYTVYAGPGTNYRVADNHFSTQLHPKVGYYNIWYWDPSEDGDVVRSGNLIHETGAPANDNL
jgi:hypothetical protein